MPCGSAFTLVELLMVIAIIAVIAGVLLPALSGTMASARSFKCQMALRSVAFDFTVFADDQLHGQRGNDELELPRNSFRLETFQNAQYGLSEFWAYDTQQLVRLPDAQGRDPMRCAAQKGDLVLRRNVPCSQGGVGPPENVSFGFNMRLHISERRAFAGATPGVVLTSKILEGAPDASPSQIPLLWDIDGAEAGRRGLPPVFSAPARSSQWLFVGDQYWFPGKRHAGKLNVAFVDGRVDASNSPLTQPGWAWDFDPGQ
jgi:prepilin-type N-terminal cleavage/methylation domain-containing protein/prepilin-type processing-associated H-X9-DG protein